MQRKKLKEGKGKKNNNKRKKRFIILISLVIPFCQGLEVTVSQQPVTRKREDRTEDFLLSSPRSTLGIEIICCLASPLG